MNTLTKLNRGFALAAIASAGLLASCSSGDPTASSSAGSSRLVVGSQAYYSNEIIAEVYSQALEAEGYAVKREFQIGQREVYLPELTEGKIDVFPEYTGSLLQALDKDAGSGSSRFVFDSLTKVLPDGLTALDPAPASDQNSWTVTKEFAEKYQLTDLASLKNVTDGVTVGGNSELETRPYGPKFLTSKYGVKVNRFRAVEDGGGPLTVKALTSGAIQLANIYTADPNIAKNNLVSLADPDGLFLPDNIAPIVSDDVDQGAREILTSISRQLTQDALVQLNSESVNEKKSAKNVAAAWLKGLGNDGS